MFNDAYTLFTIGYISGDEFHFLKYYFYDRTKKIELKAHLKAEDEIYSIKNSGISCKYMYFNLGINSELVCTYYANGAGIGLQKYERIDQSNTELECVKNLYIPTQDEVIYIKTTQIDDYNILIGWVTDKGIPYYAQYNIHFNEDEMSTIETNSFDDIKCQLKPQFFKFNFYTVKDYNGEALYTCLLERNIFPDHPNADILLGYFNSFSQNGDYTRFSTSENYFYENCTIHGYSIVYFETKYDFYVISDAVCDGIQMPIYRMFGELSEEEKLPPVTEAPIEEDLLYDSCNKCPDELCELDLKCSRPGDCKNQEYYWDKCDQPCESINSLCIKCSRDGKCLGCKDNKYWGDTCDHVCENCPEETCTVDGKCINQEDDCIDNNYYGDTCEISCSTFNSFCQKCKRDGSCVECKDEFHFGSSCDTCDKCPDEKCYFDGKCKDEDSNCKNDEYYGEKCDIQCDATTEKQYCLKCNRDETCIKCKDDKYWGSTCQNDCGFCPEDTCNKNDGKCNINGDCQNQAYYGDMCIDSCEENTACKKCKKDGTCTECQSESNFGEHCTDECSNCPNNKCDINGICKDETSNCKNNIYFGPKCDQECDSKCNKCNRDGTCIACSDNHNWGSNYDNTCPNCPGQTCESNGNCEEYSSEFCGNKAFYGLKCDEECSNKYSNCIECKKENGDCDKCSDSYFGIDCGQQCSNCPD